VRVLTPVLVLAAVLATVVPAIALPPLAPPAPDPAAVGRWNPVLIDGEVPAVSMALLHDGRVLYWSGVEAAHEHDEDMTFFLSHPHEADSRVLDLRGPIPLVITPANSTSSGSDLFCAGHTILPDGRVVAAGGTAYTTIPEAGGWDILYGTADVRFFLPETNEWVRGPDMQTGRWYPSVLTLADGDTLTASGVSTLTNPTTQATPIERLDQAVGAWEDAGDRLLPLYPRLIVVPSGPLEGKVFYTTVGTLWGPFGEHPLEAQWSLQQVYDPETKEWTFLGPSLLGARQHGVSLLLPLDPRDGYKAEVLTFGGTLQRSILAVPFAERADLSTTPPTNKPAAPLTEGRWHLNGVLLPDGKVLAVGGGRYDNVVVHGQPNEPVMTAELYDPEADKWTAVPPMQVPRMYHSTALLLPDGRVLLGGHVPLPIPFKTVRDNVAFEQQIRETRLEIYEPPYLHRGDRPEILGAAAAAHYGAAFTAVTDVAPQEIDSVVLVKPGATTHAYDAEQRVIRLEWTAETRGDGATVLTLTAPPNGNVAPPGHYMLFVNKATPDGPVPSVATFVEIG